MGWTSQYFTTIIIEGSTAQTGIFLYSPAPGVGNLVGSWAVTAGVDQFGNSYPAGINIIQGQISGVALTNVQIFGALINNAIINSPQISQPSITGGTIIETTMTFDSSGGSLLAYTSSTTTVTKSAAGQYNITFPAGVSSAKVECWGASGGGGGGSSSTGGFGAGAGEYAQEPNYAVIPTSRQYSYTVGAAGTPGVTGSAGTNGGDSFFDGTGVYANGGNSTAGSLGGTGSTNTIHFNGGNGGTASSTGGGGAGGRAGSTGPGGNGSNSTTSSGAAGGAAGTGTGGVVGGAGGNAGANGSAPGGGAGAGTAVTNLNKSYHGVHGNSYYGSDSTFNANGIRISDGSLYQGGETASGGAANGTQKSMILWPFSQIASDFAGATIDSCSVRLTNLHSWYSSGINLQIGYTNNSSLPSSYNGTPVGTLSWTSMGSLATKTINLGTTYASNIVGGSAKTLTIGPGDFGFDLNSYGYFYGVGGSNSSNPQLNITGHIGAGANTGGAGQDGQVSITYTSGNVLQASLSPTTFTDTFGNTIPVGLGQLQPSGQYSKVSGASTDQTSATCTTTANKLMTKQWPIPIGDANVGTIYRLTVYGTGTQGSTAEQLNTNAYLNGTSGTDINNTNMAAAAVVASQGFHWYYQLDVIVTATGASGTCNTAGHFTMSQAVASSPTNSETASMSSSASLFNTTVANTLELDFAWSSITGAPTITSLGSIFERLGP